MKKLCTITILPINKTLQAYEGDSLYTLLLVEGLITPEDPSGNKLRLEKGSLSPAEHPEAEEAAFTSSEQAEDWVLASERCRAEHGCATDHHARQTGSPGR